jgi:BMFP domain-containing protein YqiC
MKTRDKIESLRQRVAALEGGSQGNQIASITGAELIGRTRGELTKLTERVVKIELATATYPDDAPFESEAIPINRVVRSILDRLKLGILRECDHELLTERGEEK